MVRAPCCEKTGLNKGPWTPEEDQILVNHIRGFGHGNWRALPKQAGLLRCGKSCRLRWMNYLRPDIKRGNYTEEEEETIVQMHRKLGNRWSAIAASMPGRTDNEIKNVWNTHLKRRLVDPNVPSGTQKKRNKKSKIKSENSDASRLVQPLDRSNSGTSKNELHVESEIEGLQLETLSMDFTAAAASEFSTVDISTSIIHEFLEDSEMERFWLDALPMDVIATENPTDKSNSELSSSTIEMPNGDKAEDELHVVPEIESFWLDPLSIDFATIGIPTSPSHYFNLFNSDNDIDFWQEFSQNQEIF